jgi:hypothetical protein
VDTNIYEISILFKVIVKTVEVEVADPKVIEELDSVKKKLRTTESVLNDLELQNTSLRKLHISTEEELQVR